MYGGFLFWSIDTQVTSDNSVSSSAYSLFWTIRNEVPFCPLCSFCSFCFLGGPNPYIGDGFSHVGVLFEFQETYVGGPHTIAREVIGYHNSP